MVFSLFAWSESIAEGGAYADLKAVEDPTVTIEADTIYVPALINLIGAYAALGSTAIAAYLDSPSLRARHYNWIAPIQKGLAPSGAESFRLHPLSPVPLVQYEGLKAYSKADPEKEEQHTIIAFLSDGPIAPVSGEIHTIRASASIEEVAGEWASGPLTFEQPLPSGTYNVVGARVKCDGNGIAFRFIPIGQVWRPGALCVNDVGAKELDETRFGGLGVWFSFDPRTPPTLEVLASAAGGTSQEVLIDLIKTA
jgi:hypothetical protein